jgi:hypothetical protein
MTSFKPPSAVQSAARRGLELRRKWKRGGLSNAEASSQGIGSGVQRASNLANGTSLSLETVKRMHAFFSRHQGNRGAGKKESDGGPTAGYIAWLLWGGDAGRRWAASIAKQHAEKSEVNMSNEIDELFAKSIDWKWNQTHDEAKEHREMEMPIKVGEPLRTQVGVDQDGDGDEDDGRVIVEKSAEYSVADYTGALARAKALAAIRRDFVPSNFGDASSYTRSVTAESTVKPALQELTKSEEKVEYRFRGWTIVE